MDDPLARSCGRAVMGCSVSIKDADGCDLPCGEVGEVVVSGTNVMKDIRTSLSKPPRY